MKEQVICRLPSVRKYNGKKYRRMKTVKKKSDALKSARGYRNKGRSARVATGVCVTSLGKRYAVYVRMTK